MSFDFLVAMAFSFPHIPGIVGSDPRLRRNRFAMQTTQSSLPKGHPRCALHRKSSSSAALSVSFTHLIHWRGRSTGHSLRKSKSFAGPLVRLGLGGGRRPPRKPRSTLCDYLEERLGSAMRIVLWSERGFSNPHIVFRLPFYSVLHPRYTAPLP